MVYRINARFGGKDFRFIQTSNPPDHSAWSVVKERYMPQKRPEYLPDHCYHFYNRGRDRLSIFIEQDNYLFLIRKLKKYTCEIKLTLLAYCLMPNHYHFLVRQDGEQNAGLLSQRVFNSYSKAYNKRYQHSGTLFEGEYHVKLVDNDRHLLHLCRYIHANPVNHGIVTRPEDWPYSNYLEWAGLREGTLVDRRFVHDHFCTPSSYVEFMEDYLRTRNLPSELRTYLNTIES